MSSDPNSSLMPLVREVAREAGELALRHFRAGEKTSAKVWSKAGGSPVTEADVQVDTFLKIRLSEALPAAAWLSEETADDPRRLGRELVWIVDPIDGTRAFMSGNADWSVAIALLRDDRPILGIVHAPAHDLLYEAEAGGGALRNGQPIAVSPAERLDTVGVAGPAPLVDRLARRAPGLRRLPRVPSLALRIVRVADGAIDVGLISGNARDWDIAGADMILTEAGGALTDLAGRPAPYNRADPGHGELVAAPRRLQASLIEAITAS